MRLAYKWRVLISVIFGIFMVVLDSTVINVAFPTLRKEFGASVTDSQWIISVYTLALGIATPLSGFLADRIGIKRTYVSGLACFVVGSAICGIAPNLGILIAARGLQGFGGGIALPLGTALLFSAFTAAEQGIAFGVFGIALVVAPALGPILGGYLVDQNVWRWIFFINVPIGILGVVLASLWLHERGSEYAPALDVLGFIFSCIGFGAVLYAASIASTDGWSSAKVITFFAIGGVGLVLFGLVELFVAREPLLDLRLFRRATFTVATIVGWVSVLALFGAEFLLPLYLQSLRGKTALETGFILLPLAIMAGITTPVAGLLYDKVGPRILIVTGFAILMVNTWQFSQLNATTPIGWILFLLALRGFALGMTIQNTLLASLSVVSGREVARASALSNATRQVVQSIGVAVLATVLVSTLSPQVQAFQNQFQSTAQSSTAAATGLCEVKLPTTAPASGNASTSGASTSNGTSTGASGTLQGAPPNASDLLKQACNESIQGYQKAYTLTFYFAALALLFGLFLPGWPGKWSGRRGPSAEERTESTEGTATLEAGTA